MGRAQFARQRQLSIRNIDGDEHTRLHRTCAEQRGQADSAETHDGYTRIEVELRRIHHGADARDHCAPKYRRLIEGQRRIDAHQRFSGNGRKIGKRRHAQMMIHEPPMMM